MLTRKRFLTAAGVSAGALAAGCGGEDSEEREREARQAADREIVRFLLRVERVTSAFWDQVEQRRALAEGDIGELATQIARNERGHIDSLLRFARRLGGEDGTPPRTNFGDAFAAGPEEVL